jgi:predicted DNA-binding transcriptional regulator AlpA
MATSDTLEALLTEHDVARITGLSVASVRRWRLLRQGPRYLKIGSAVRYRPEDVAAWLRAAVANLPQRALDVSISAAVARARIAQKA